MAGNGPAGAGADSSRGPLGIIAGSGVLPRRLIEACRANGRGAFVLALTGHADADLVEGGPHGWCRGKTA